MPEAEETEGSGPQGIACPRCGSERVRRSAPRGLGERFTRILTPVHYFRCRSCGHRGWHWGRVSRRRRRRDAQPPGRPVEKRDLEAVRTRRARTLLAVAAAVGLGAAAGIIVQTCQQRGVPGSTRSP